MFRRLQYNYDYLQLYMYVPGTVFVQFDCLSKLRLHIEHFGEICAATELKPRITFVLIYL